MSTDLPTLTTEELCARCEEATRFKPSIHQLGDWVSLGFLPPSEAGAGRGRRIGGTEPRRWDAECVPRVIVIVRSRKGKHISVRRAALALAIMGYYPGDTYFKVALNTYLAEWKKVLNWCKGLQNPEPPGGRYPYQQFKVLSAERQFERYGKAAKRRNADIPPPLREHIIAQSAMVRGIAVPNAPEPMSKFGQYLSLSGFQAAVDAASDDELRAAYEKATLLLQGLQLELADSLLLLVTALSTAIDGAVPASSVRDAFQGIVLSFLPGDVQDVTLSVSAGMTLERAFRLFGTLMILIADQPGKPLVQLGDEAVLPLLEMLSSFAKKTGGSKQAISK